MKKFKLARRKRTKPPPEPKVVTEEEFKPRLKRATIAALNELVNSGVRMTTISKETGISQPWLGMFMSGKIKGPASDRVEYLYFYATGRRIKSTSR